MLAAPTFAVVNTKTEQKIERREAIPFETYGPPPLQQQQQQQHQPILPTPIYGVPANFAQYPSPPPGNPSPIAVPVLKYGPPKVHVEYGPPAHSVQQSHIGKCLS